MTANTTSILRRRRKALRKQNNAKYGYDQFGLRILPKRLASHSRPMAEIVSRRESYAILASLPRVPFADEALRPLRESNLEGIECH